MLNNEDTEFILNNFISTSSYEKDVITLLKSASSVAKEAWLSKTNINARKKPDNSDITDVDLRLNTILTEGLHELSPTIPIVSEENNVSAQSSRIKWIIDPLDETTKFINGKAGFSINVALILDDNPILGFVACPAHDSIYFSTLDGIAYKQDKDENTTTVHINSQNKKIAVMSASSTLEEAYKKVKGVLYSKFNFKLPENFITIDDMPPIISFLEGQVGACIKIGRDKTLRGSGGYIWDNAAFHALVRAAGGGIVDIYNHHTSLSYADGRKRQHGFLVTSKENRNLFPDHPASALTY